MQRGSHSARSNALKVTALFKISSRPGVADGHLVPAEVHLHWAVCWHRGHEEKRAFLPAQAQILKNAIQTSALQHGSALVFLRLEVFSYFGTSDWIQLPSNTIYASGVTSSLCLVDRNHHARHPLLSLACVLSQAKQFLCVAEYQLTYLLCNVSWETN